jgi:hypothetical protein
LPVPTISGVSAAHLFQRVMLALKLFPKLGQTRDDLVACAPPDAADQRRQ